MLRQDDQKIRRSLNRIEDLRVELFGLVDLAVPPYLRLRIGCIEIVFEAVVKRLDEALSFPRVVAGRKRVVLPCVGHENLNWLLRHRFSPKRAPSAVSEIWFFYDRYDLAATPSATARPKLMKWLQEIRTRSDRVQPAGLARSEITGRLPRPPTNRSSAITCSASFAFWSGDSSCHGTSSGWWRRASSRTGA
jgi:hypothetical protein